MGAVLSARMFRMDFGEVAIPVALLCAGCLTALILSAADRRNALPAWKWWFPVLLYALVIFALSDRSYPDADLGSFDTKLFHPAEYFSLGLFLSIAWNNVLKKHGIVPYLCCVLFSGILFAASDEYHQSFVPGRSPEVADVFIDFGGLALGCGVHLAFGRRLMQLRRRPPCDPRLRGGGT